MKKLLPLLTIALAACSTAPAPRGCGQEKFDAFLPRYMSDRPFATGRTVFPLESIAALQEKKTVVSREQFAKSDLLADLIRIEKLSSRQSVSPAQAELTVFRPDSDSLVYTYRFRQQDGCWYMWQFEDASL
jgi:hypothetical protein